jgi:hypothetical protein
MGMQAKDLVVAPRKDKAAMAVGKIEGPYVFDAAATPAGLRLSRYRNGPPTPQITIAASRCVPMRQSSDAPICAVLHLG